MLFKGADEWINANRETLSKTKGRMYRYYEMEPKLMYVNYPLLAVNVYQLVTTPTYFRFVGPLQASKIFAVNHMINWVKKKLMIFF